MGLTTPTVALDRISEVLDYHPESGLFRWKVHLGARRRAGSIAGCVNAAGYVVISIDGRQFRATRLAWVLTYGRWPSGVVDHIDHDRLNNRITNLRDVSVSVNTQNQVRSSIRSRSGLLGVYPSGYRWGAKIVVNGRRTYLGQFDSAQEAHEAYVAAKRRLHPGCTL